MKIKIRELDPNPVWLISNRLTQAVRYYRADLPARVADGKVKCRLMASVNHGPFKQMGGRELSALPSDSSITLLGAGTPTILSAKEFHGYSGSDFFPALQRAGAEQWRAAVA